jgi:hypothetical protein
MLFLWDNVLKYVQLPWAPHSIETWLRDFDQDLLTCPPGLCATEVVRHGWRFEVLGLQSSAMVALKPS